MRMPSRRCKEPIFLGSCPKQRGVLRGHSQQVGRSGFSCAACSSAPLKCAFRQGFLSHKNPCASVWARAHISPPQDGILNKGRCRAGRLHNRRPWGQELPPPNILPWMTAIQKKPHFFELRVVKHLKEGYNKENLSNTRIDAARKKAKGSQTLQRAGGRCKPVGMGLVHFWSCR